MDIQAIAAAIKTEVARFKGGETLANRLRRTDDP